MTLASKAEDALRLERLRQAHSASSTIARYTPLLSSASVSQRCGGTIALKAECLQRTGSFKLRGALNKLRAITAETVQCRGVVAGSAGNHAQSLAYAAQRLGVRCEIFMPVQAAVSKLAAVRAFGAVVHQQGGSVDECVALARQRADELGLAFVHPFDDCDVIAGQAGIGIELAETVADLRKVIVPVGGGGLASGVAIALAQIRPDVEVVGVQAAVCAPVAASLAQDTLVAGASSHTIADGIAIKRPGRITLPLIARHVSSVVTVEDETIADAIVLLLERSKLVVEGAGAVSVAALLSGAVRPAEGGTTVAILSGGNIDTSALSTIAVHHENRANRRVRLFTQVRDEPGSLVRLLTAVARANANIIDVVHVRNGVALPIGKAGVVLTVETHGHDHLAMVTRAVCAAGYELSDSGGYGASDRPAAIA